MGGEGSWKLEGERRRTKGNEILLLFVVFVFSDFQISPGLKSLAENLFGIEFVYSVLHT
jgi:hypothetical protein